MDVSNPSGQTRNESAPAGKFPPADRRAMLAGIGGLAAGALLVGARSAHAGPLTPPDGPITSTYKTLDEVEPRIAINATNTPGDADSLFKISQPGSYYLTGNITGVAGKHGIEIAASGVTLDLNGFELIGVPDAGNFSAVNTPNLFAIQRVTVRNGSIRDWGGSGVALRSTSTDGSMSVVAEVHVVNCGVTGIQIVNSANVRDCTVIGCNNGISVGMASTVSNCIARSGVNIGIAVGDASTVIGSSARNNSIGIAVGNGCTVADCSASFNAGTGIAATGASSSISNCSVRGNTGSGISIGASGTVSNCSAHENTGSGITTVDGCTVSHCTAHSNTANGINAGSGSTVSNCTVSANGVHGILCASRCVVRGNTCDSNGTIGNGAGIYVTGADNRIEDNNCTTADLGIVLLGAGNVLIKNTCSGNTINYDIFTGNRYGQIVNITAANPATVSGNSGVSTMGSTDPWANFAY